MKYYDEEERHLIESIELAFDKGELTIDPRSEEIGKEMQQMAKDHIAQKKEEKLKEAQKVFNFSLEYSDLEKIKIQAKKEGIPLKRFVVSVLSQFAEGKLQKI